MQLEELDIRKQAVTAFNKKRIYTARQLAEYIPYAYHDYRKPVCTADAVSGRFCAVKTKIVSAIKKSGSKPYLHIKAVDADGTWLNIMAFGGIYYLHRTADSLMQKNVVICGRMSYDEKFGWSMTGIESMTEERQFRPSIVPVYRKIKGISDEKLAEYTAHALKESEKLLPDAYYRGIRLKPYKDALSGLHNPKSEEDLVYGHRTLLFNDLLYFCLKFYTGGKDRRVSADIKKHDMQDGFISSLPFALTEDQKKAIEALTEKALAKEAVDAVLQGDVGCGKTIVAFAMTVLMHENGYQSVLMAPRGVLARQHYEDAKRMLEPLGIKCVFLHSGMKAGERREALAKIASGEASVIVGTHSCISEDVRYKAPALMITDEEHLFGVEQKTLIREKMNGDIHALSMSATPIPRTLGSAFYGEDKEIINIHTMPGGRKKIQTAAISNRKKAMEFMEKQIRLGRQCYVVCPAIEGPASGEMTSIAAVKDEYEDYFKGKGIELGVITGKEKKEANAETIERFRDNSIQVLLSTTVIEVGVNVPNATVMVIEEADRFGLSSLHQLRGRVGRGSEQSYCILITDDKTNERIATMVRTTDGFEIAEEDLRLRGSGDLIGIRQSGTSRYVEEMIKNPKMFIFAKSEAKRLEHSAAARDFIKVFDETEAFTKD